jgi:hypothetical protein
VPGRLEGRYAVATGDTAQEECRVLGGLAEHPALNVSDVAARTIRGIA